MKKFAEDEQFYDEENQIKTATTKETRTIDTHRPLTDGEYQNFDKSVDDNASKGSHNQYSNSYMNLAN